MVYILNENVCRAWGPNTTFIVELPLKLSVTTDERYHRAPNARNVRPLMRDHKMVIKSKTFGPHHMNAVQQNGKRLQKHENLGPIVFFFLK